MEGKPPPTRCELGKLKEKNMMQREGHSSKCWTLLQHDEAEIPRHEMLSDFYIDHMSFQHSEIPSTSHHGSECAENSKADMYVEDEFCVVDPCHSKNDHICQLLEEKTSMENILVEPHHLSGSLKEDKKKLREDMKNIVDINALVERCCWKASSGDMEGKYFLEECIALKEGMSKIKESYMNLISDREHLLMVDEMYHNAIKKEEEE